MTFDEAVERVERHLYTADLRDDVYQALACVLERAKEPRVYALGERHRLRIEHLRDEAVDQSEDAEDEYAKGHALADAAALAAALSLQEPFTVEKLRAFESYARWQATERRKEGGDWESWIRTAAKLNAYIEARKEG